MIGTVSEIAAVVGGTLDGDGEVRVTGVSFDSRRIAPGEIFFALVARRDGHEFVPAAVEGGAAAVVVSRAVKAQVPVIRVPDTLRALQVLGSRHRQRMEATVVGLTGSCGKTTVRELIAAALEASGRVHRSRENLNNHIGVPVTLSALTPEHSFCVVEMGANHHGEIAELTRIASPDVGLVTCVAEAHTEFFGGLDQVARAKGELFAGMRPDSVAVVNVDDPWVRRMDVVSRRTVTYGSSKDADVQLESTQPLVRGGQELTVKVEGGAIVTRLELDGPHNALNATGALAAAVACGVDPHRAASCLCGVQPVAGRGAWRKGRRLTVMDDAYNANPSSMKAGLRTLVGRAQGLRSVAVLGEMFELGAGADEMHQAVGAEAASLGVARLVAVGGLAQSIRQGAVDAGMNGSLVTCFETTREALEGIGEIVRDDDLVLVKGSRAMKMERIVEFLLYW